MYWERHVYLVVRDDKFVYNIIENDLLVKKKKNQQLHNVGSSGAKQN